MKNHVKELEKKIEIYSTTAERIAYLNGALYGFNEAKKVFKRVQKSQFVKTLCFNGVEKTK